MEHLFGHQQRGVADVKLQDGVVEKHGGKLTGVQTNVGGDSELERQ